MKRLISILTTAAMLLIMTIAPISTSAASIPKPAKVSLKSVKTVSTSALKATWKNVEEATGYQIKVSSYKNFKNARTINTVNASMKTITKLKKSGTKYYVKIRAYKKVNGNKKYGNWSKVKSASTKAKVTAKKTTVNKGTTSSSTASYSYGSGAYVLNPDSMKIHRSGCRTFKYESQYPTTNDLYGALARGYSRCGVCLK